jgi:vitamin B12 transporter
MPELKWIIPKIKSSLFAEANNVFDKQYSDLLGAPMPGRWLMGGWRINL